MEVLDAILSRRSIRKYTDIKISNETIEKLVEAAMYAPSAKNLRPWHFIIINKKEALLRLSVAHPYGSMLKIANHAILVCGDSEIEKMEDYIVQDCSAATQNILLAAHAMGLGAVWLGVHPRKKRINDISKLLELPKNIIPVSLISIGDPAEKKQRPKRVIPERIHFNKW
ncbi:MAG: nitroreductase family protein [Bacteroidales bacterium]|nr:nitroreductase family protein [Bacteroidales bacterium]